MPVSLGEFKTEKVPYESMKTIPLVQRRSSIESKLRILKTEKNMASFILHPSLGVKKGYRYR